MEKLNSIWNALSTIATARSLYQWIWPSLLMGVPAVVATIITYVSHNPWVAIIIGILAMGATIVLAYFITKPTKKKIEGKKIFPYIRTVSASSLIDAGEEYLSFSVFFPSQIGGISLSLEGELIIDGATSNRLETKDITLSNLAVVSISDWRAILTKVMVNHIRQCVDTNKPVKVSAHIWDKNKKTEYYWETEQWTTLLLTKLN